MSLFKPTFHQELDQLLQSHLARRRILTNTNATQRGNRIGEKEREGEEEEAEKGRRKNKAGGNLI